MDAPRVFVIGDSLFAETLAQLLARAGVVNVINAAPTCEAALPLLAQAPCDALVCADTGDLGSLGLLLAAYPDLPIIRADLDTDSVQVITSRRVGARTSDLLAAIAALPKRSDSRA
jgi:DNA-binding NarL/FixJ family response regulator